MRNSFSCQPATTFSAKRPPEMWSIVAPCLAASSGWIVETCEVVKTAECSVACAIAAAQVYGSRHSCDRWPGSPST